MPAIISQLNHRTWLLLSLATVINLSVRAEGLVGYAAGFATIAIAAFKGRLVVLDFMEMRHAPRVWRGVLEGWLLLVTAMILVFYSLGYRA